MNKKKIIILVVVAVAIVVGAFFGIRAYNNYITQQQIEASIKEIEDVFSTFESTDNRAEKLEMLLQFKNDNKSTVDELSAEVKKAVEPVYLETLDKMKNFFTADYYSTIDKNTVSDISIKEHRKEILSSINNLTKLINTVDEEKDIVFGSDNSEYKSLCDKINELTKKYRTSFTNYYNDIIKDNTYKDPEKIEDKSKLSTAVSALSELKKSVENEKIEVYENDEESYNEIIKSIDGLIKQYQKYEAVNNSNSEVSYSNNADHSNESYSSNDHSDSYNEENYDSDYNSNNYSSDDSSNNSNQSYDNWGWWGEGDDYEEFYWDSKTGDAYDTKGEHWNVYDVRNNS